MSVYPRPGLFLGTGGTKSSPWIRACILLGKTIDMQESNSVISDSGKCYEENKVCREMEGEGKEINPLVD